MRRQRNMAQMKEQIKTPENELNKMEISNLSDAEFKTLVIRMLNEFRGRIDEFSENFSKDMASIKMEAENKKEPVKSKEHDN